MQKVVLLLKTVNIQLLFPWEIIFLLYPYYYSGFLLPGEYRQCSCLTCGSDWDRKAVCSSCYFCCLAEPVIKLHVLETKNNSRAVSLCLLEGKFPSKYLIAFQISVPIFCIFMPRNSVTFFSLFLVIFFPFFLMNSGI